VLPAVTPNDADTAPETVWLAFKVTKVVGPTKTQPEFTGIV
jgi:hypothetical protein